ncbi:hypothetical protein FZC66_15455 [Priestia megaterium]|nr:hypothetical protein FZC66_15455 [Priestia megaterium]
MNRNSPSPKDDTTQLKQKLIHYRSELKHYEYQLKQYEKALEREKENTTFWKNKHAEAFLTTEKDKELEELEKELYHLKNELSEQAVITDALKEKLARKQPIIEEKIVEKIIEKPVEKIVEKPVKVEVERFQATDVISYFQHSIVMSSSEDEESIVFGNVIIANQTSKTLHSPVLCLKIKPSSSAVLNGKIIDEKEMESSTIPSSSLQWQYAHPKWRDKIKEDGEYWIKPVRTAAIEQNRKLVFESFQLIIPPSEEHTSLVLEGYFYSEEWPGGLPFLNKIVLNFS